jgi:hypothetical protein
MAGDVPIPIEPLSPPPWAGPTEGPPPIPTPTIPHIGNPVPYIVHGAEAAWSDVASWVSDRWHSLLGFGETVAGVTFQDVSNIVTVALSAEQTAWASFVSTLESWINETTSFLEDAISAAEGLAISIAIDVWLQEQADVAAILGWALGAVHGIEQSLARQWWDTVQAIDGAVAGVEAWAIDNIYHPLLGEITGEIARVEAEIGADVRALERDLANLNVGDIAGLAARLAAIAAAVSAVTTWVEDCGAPMCEQMGPKTDWSKLLKVLNVAGMLALLTSVGTLTEAELEQLAVTVASIGASPAATFVDDFVTAGDTLAAAIADAVPAIAL